MGKQYISTNVVGDSHSSDLLDLAISDKYTITVSGDGYSKFWDNKMEEVDDPKEHVVSKLIDDSGIHHINIFETIIPDSHVKVVVIGYGCFNGTTKIQSFIDDDISTLTEVTEFKGTYWCPIFYKDPESEQDLLIVTSITGEITLWNMSISPDGKDIQFSEFNKLTPTESNFPISIDVSIDKKLAVGYTKGDVMLYHLLDLKAIYTFHSTDLISGNSNSIPRVVKFSPGGSILVVARDNQNAGSINLYDVKYGENIGALTKPSHSSKSTIGGFAHDGWIMGLSFDDEGKFLASCGFDKCIRVWNLENKEREATINLSLTDFQDFNGDEHDSSIASGVQFIKKGIRGGLGGGSNNGLCVISFDRGIRWYREAGGI